MSDIRAGSIIRDSNSDYVDWPDTVSSFDNTSNNNQTSTSFTVGTPTVDLTFVAGTTGRALISIALSSRDNSSTNRVISTFELYQGTSTSGTSVISSSGSTLEYECTSAGQASGFQYITRTTLVTGLTPGATYYARQLFKVTGGSTADVAMRELTVRPAS